MSLSLFDLSGRCALVTGGSRGIGEMIARGFLLAGARVLIGSRSERACAAARERLADAGPVDFAVGDLSTRAGIEQVAAAATSQGPIDILVNNAGVSAHQMLPEFTEASWDRVVDLNLKAAYFLTQKCVPMLSEAASPERPSKVINVASIEPLYNTAADSPSYIASKAGLISVTRHFALKLVSQNIIVSAIAPGAFPSDMNQFARDHPELCASGIPARRVGSWQDMAGVAVFLAARSGDYVVGDAVVVDGGITHAHSPSPRVALPWQLPGKPIQYSSE